MAFQTFNPPCPPSPGTENRPEVKLYESELGNGYTQTIQQGYNNIRRVYTLSWDLLLPAQAEELDAFLSAHGGATPFIYTISDSAGPMLFTCKEWSDTRADNGFRRFSATFRQSFVPG